jgi:hypothetical protein
MSTAATSASLGWTLDIPGIVHILRSEPLRPLASLSYNRWVFATGIALVILAAIGLEHLRTAAAGFRWWFVAPVLVTAAFGGWCLVHRLALRDAKDQQLFSVVYDSGVLLSLAALTGWFATVRAIPHGRWIRLGAIALLLCELFWFAWSERRQADVALYFPRIPVLEQIATLPMGRVWGIGCFPPNLNLVCGLQDVRGYDAVDPLLFFELFELAVDPRLSAFHPYALTQYAAPLARESAGASRLHPVADLLNVRYLICRERPRGGLPVILQQDGYWILENRAALPRAYVPRSVKVVKDDRQALSEMSSVEFDPRRDAFVTDELRLPETMRGTVTVRYETPTRTELDVDMQTAGLVLLSDLWDPGWHAELDGVACPIHRVDVALRGFEVPAGKHRITCTDDPQGVRAGFQRGVVGVGVLLLWVTWKGLGGLRHRLGARRNASAA